jgi:hypothetical protein
MTKIPTALFFIAAVSLAAGCGPKGRGQGDDTGDDAPDANFNCTPTAVSEGPGTCNDGFDNDCDLYQDCGELECSGIDGCPVSGGNCEVSTPTAELSLPDGDCTGIDPGPGATEAQMDAFLATCNAYEATLTLSGFPAGARLDDTSLFLGVCVNMEHSWLRDLQMEAYSPDGQRVLLSKFRSADCPSGPCEVYLGDANDFDDDANPVPGTGWDYCFTTGAPNGQMLDVANAAPDPFPSIYQLPAGDYSPSQPFTNFQGSNLNGGWRIRVVDGWGIDNGYIFEAKFMFHGSLSDDCPVIE